MLLNKGDIFQNKFYCLIVCEDFQFVLSCLKHSEILNISRVLSRVFWFKVTEGSRTISVSIITISCKINKSSHEIQCQSDPDDCNTIAEMSSFLMN